MELGVTMRGMNRGLYPQSPSATFAQDFAGGLAVGQSVGNTISGIGHQARLKSISDAVNKAGGDISAIDSSLYSDPEGMVALGGFLDQYTTTQEGLLKAKDAHSKVAEQQFQTLSNGLQYLEQNQGNPQALTAGIEQLSRHLNLPYNVKFNPERNAFDVLYQDRAGEKQTGQSMTAQEVVASLKELVQHSDKFHSLYAQNALSIMAGNNAYKQDPSKWFYAQGDDGRAITLIPQKQPRPEGGIELGYLILEKGQPARFATMKELSSTYGITPQTWEQHYKNQQLDNDKVRLGYEGQRVLQGWAEHNLNLERFKYEKGDELIPGMPGINRKGLKKTMDADFNQWMAASGYTEKNGVFYKPEYNKDGSIVVDAQENPKLKAMSPAEVGEARAEHQQDFVKRYTGQSAPGQGGDVGNIILSRGLEYKGGKPSVPPAGNGGNIPSQGKTSTEQPARLGGGMVSESEKKVAMLGGLLAHGIPGETDEEMLGGPPRINKRIPQKTPAETKEHMLSRLHSKGIPGETDIELARSKQNTSASLNWYDRYRQFTQSQWAPTQLSGTEEAAFKEWLIKSRWFREIKDNIERHEGKVDDNRLFAELTGPHADYDYRGAWKADVGAQDYKYDDRMHWPSSTGDGRILKSPKHSTAWMEFFMEEYGIDPNSLGLHSAEAALEYVRKAKLVPR